MGDFEKLRVEEIKTKKARDDKLNRLKEVEKKTFKTSFKENVRREAQSLVPFYERI